MPKDSHWRRFIGDLEEAFGRKCGYCEEYDKGEVDHFRPKSKFPREVYSWSNLVFACHNCNNAKRDRWPESGYLDPCAEAEGEWPESCLIFDVVSGHVEPRDTLNAVDREKAVVTIRDIRLNALHHLKKRVLWMEVVSALIEQPLDEMNAERREILRKMSSREWECSSFTRAMLLEHGFPVLDESMDGG